MNRFPVSDIEFINTQSFINGKLKLVCTDKVRADHDQGFLPYYKFVLKHLETNQHMGHINLRVGYNEHVNKYRGHIGFKVLEQFRGNYYAAKSCLLLKPIIRHHSLKPIYFTCNEGNIASIKTIEFIGGQYLETVKMSDDYPYIEYYSKESQIKRRYEWLVDKI